MSLQGFFIIYLLPLSVVVGYLLGGWFTFLTPLMVFGLIPLLDVLLGVNTRNPLEQDEKRLTARMEYRYVTWFCVPLQLGLVLWGAWVVTHRSLSPLELAGFVFSMGISSGAMGINVSHELVHRIDNRLEPFLGRLMLASVCYIHWAIEHVRGHHRNVATPLDPATASLGESFYSFWPRTILGGLRSSWNLEAARLERKGQRVWNPGNTLLCSFAAEILILVGLGWAFGVGAILYFLVQSFVAVSLLEVVNYLEHYGMQRRLLENGKYEKVTPLHSWNSSHWVTNYFLFNLQRHSDHHARPNRRYQVLRHFGESPQLPNGYAGMVLLALCPPLWRKVMDNRVEEFHRQAEVQAGEGLP
jgi:alkane 1-monooxygenase